MEHFNPQVAIVQDGAGARLRVELATNALDAVRDLCTEAAHVGPNNTLAHVDADNFACLLGLIVDELRDASAIPNC